MYARKRGSVSRRAVTGQDVGQLTGMSVGRDVDVDVEVTGDHQWR